MSFSIYLFAVFFYLLFFFSAFLQGARELQALRKNKMLTFGLSFRSLSTRKSKKKKRYTFAYLESVSRGVKRGEKLLQLGVGGGMKASAAVWKCLRDSKEAHPVWYHLSRKPVEHHELPRLIDETREEAAAVAAEVARDGELLAAARDAERRRLRAEATAVAAVGTLRADSATDHEIELALPRPGKGGGGGGAPALDPSRAVEA